jgi:hypothetical protein
MIDLLAPRLQVLLITFKYSAIADLHNFHLAVAHALGLSVFSSRLFATDLNTVVAFQFAIKSSCYFVFNHSGTSN